MAIKEQAKNQAQTAPKKVGKSKNLAVAYLRRHKDTSGQVLDHSKAFSSVENSVLEQDSSMLLASIENFVPSSKAEATPRLR